MSRDWSANVELTRVERRHSERQLPAARSGERGKADQPMSPAARPELQREVQRLVGRCMLRLQQYERLMKTVLVHHTLAGPVETLEAQRSARVDELADKSLGIVVKALFETYAIATGCERELLPEDKTPTDRVSMAISYRITMEPERLAQTRAAVEELVAMRNELVHHFIERFDVWSDEGCVAAVRHLEGCYAQIDLRLSELAAWARGMEEARAIVASFPRIEVFHDMVVNGIAPDGSFNWSGSGIVQVLREANRSMSQGAGRGWTRRSPGLRSPIPSRRPQGTAAAHGRRCSTSHGCSTWCTGPQATVARWPGSVSVGLADATRAAARLSTRVG